MCQQDPSSCSLMVGLDSRNSRPWYVTMFISVFPSFQWLWQNTSQTSAVSFISLVKQSAIMRCVGSQEYDLSSPHLSLSFKYRMTGFMSLFRGDFVEDTDSRSGLLSEKHLTGIRCLTSPKRSLSTILA